MSVRFLLFRGQWENEGKFYALESEDSLIILAAGQDYSSLNSEEEQLSYSYLKEKSNKLKAIIVNNTSFQNIGLLAKICQEFASHIPLYASVHSKLIIHYLYPRLKNKIIVMSAAAAEVTIGDFTGSFFPLNSYLLGNYAVALHHSQFSFYLIEDLLLSNCWDNELLIKKDFWPSFSSFLEQKNETTYLITSFHDIRWQTNNSLFFVPTNLFFSPNQTKFWILYEFDWLHILELLEIARRHQKKVRIMDERFLLLIRQILAKSPLGEVIDEEEKEIILLVVDYTNIEKKISHFLKEFKSEEKSGFHFVVGTPPIIGGEEKLARIIDYLHTQSKEITNLSKSEYLNFRTNLADWKLILNSLQPHRIILLQNSYKNTNYLSYLPSKILLLGNQHSYHFPTEKISPLPTKKTLTTLEEILIKQRRNLREEGLLIVLFWVSWQEAKLELKKMRLETLGISSSINFPKLETTVKKWWSKKLTWGLRPDEPLKTTKAAIKRRCNELIKNYLSKEYEIELEELPVLLFIN